MTDNAFLIFIMTIFTALAMENIVFTRALGLSRTSLFMNRPKTGILYGVLMTWSVTVSTLLVSLIYLILQERFPVGLMSALVYLLCVCATYVGTWLVTQKKFPRLFALIKHALAPATFNSALFGIFFITSLENLGFMRSIAYSIGAGIGYTAALLIIYYARKRLAISPVSRSWRGMPILLLYIGFISLAVYGLIGHGLPT